MSEQTTATLERPTEARERAEHLLRRVGYGVRESDAADPSQLVRVLLGDASPTGVGEGATPDQSGSCPPSVLASPVLRLGVDAASLQRWWIDRLLTAEDPLAERLTLFWHGHFTASFRTVMSPALMLRQHGVFRALGGVTGSFADLLRAMVRDPATLRYLDADRNAKGQLNENLARELLELFGLGAGHYTETDIREGARALTGYRVSVEGEFRFEPGLHDATPKMLLGRRGEWNGDDFADLVLDHPACARRVCARLYRCFVSDLPRGPTPESEACIESLAGVLRGSGYRLRPVLRALFTCDHFYDPAHVGAMVKTPAQLLAGTARVLRTPPRDASVLRDAMEAMGENLFDPPSVAGWEGGRAWLNAATLFARQNLCAYLITGRTPGPRGVLQQADTLAAHAEDGYDPRVLLEGVEGRETETIVDHLLERLLAMPCRPAARAELIGYVRDRGGVGRASLTGLLLLICALPEYQLC